MDNLQEFEKELDIRKTLFFGGLHNSSHFSFFRHLFPELLIYVLSISFWTLINKRFVSYKILMFTFFKILIL